MAPAPCTESGTSESRFDPLVSMKTVSTVDYLTLNTLFRDHLSKEIQHVEETELSNYSPMAKNAYFMAGVNGIRPESH